MLHVGSLHNSPIVPQRRRQMAKRHGPRFNSSAIALGILCTVKTSGICTRCESCAFFIRTRTHGVNLRMRKEPSSGLLQRKKQVYTLLCATRRARNEFVLEIVVRVYTILLHWWAVHERGEQIVRSHASLHLIIPCLSRFAVATKTPIYWACASVGGLIDMVCVCVGWRKHHT